jgi:hypothetical protein
MDELFLAIYRYSGIPYHRWFMCGNKHSATFAAKGIAHRRNVDVPSESTILIQIYQVGITVGCDISKARADEYVQQMYDMRKKMGHPQPEDIDRNAPDRMLYQPVTARGRSFISSFPSDFRL